MYDHSQEAAGVGAVKRLWLVLARQEAVQDTFIRVLFSRRGPLGPGLGSAADSDHETATDPIKIIHKEQDAITAFCINQVGPGRGVVHVDSYRTPLCSVTRTL